jgi:hypothetical protein
VVSKRSATLQHSIFTGIILDIPNAIIERLAMTILLVDVETSEQFKVTEPSCKIGTASSNQIVLTGEDISPVHVRIDQRGNDYFVALEPGGAATKKLLFFFTIPNCTLNRNVLTSKPTPLKNGDKLLIGSRLLQAHFV